MKLVFVLSPIAMLYPLAATLRAMTGQQQQQWYLKVCLKCVEWSGAAVIKLMQWAGSRPDMFGDEFCSVFKKLQDHTTPHARKYTEIMMQEAFGDDWESRIKIDEVIGSGCIGQVYRGTITTKDGPERVAVKVMHPNVRDDIDNDLDIMRIMAVIAEKLPYGIGHRLRWYNLPGAVEEFATLLKLQLDMRREAYNLERFNKNFAHDDDVVFPKMIKGYNPTRDVLIETYCEGTPVLTWAKEHRDDFKSLTKLCEIGIRTVCKMIFVDNFVHGDLHPGNIFVSPGGKHFVLLDAGMVTEYTDADHSTIIQILASFIWKDGQKAGRLMLDDSNRRATKDEEQALNEEAYVEKVKDLTVRANGPDYLMEQLGSYITFFFDAATEHHVLMNQAFVSAALAIKIQEGIVLALNPKVNIYDIANPIVLKGELNRKARHAKRRVKKLFGITEKEPESRSLV